MFQDYTYRWNNSLICLCVIQYKSMSSLSCCYFVWLSNIGGIRISSHVFYYLFAYKKKLLVSLCLYKKLYRMKFSDRHPLSFDKRQLFSYVFWTFKRNTQIRKVQNDLRTIRKRNEVHRKINCVFNNDRIISNFLCTFISFSRIIHIMFLVSH